MINILNRNRLTDLLSYHSIGCELGVFEGEFSQILWDSNKFDELYLVDLFSGKASNFGKIYQDASVLYNIVKQKFNNNFGIKINQQDSVTFLKSIPSNYFDFIYIDTTHSYDTTVLELSEAYRCIKNNGYICGHDYTAVYFAGVVDAVNEFCASRQTELNIVDQHEQYPSFYMKISK